MSCSRRRAGIAGFLLAALSVMPLSAADAANEEFPSSLISFDGVRPALFAPDDPLAQSVGVLFVSPELYAKRPDSTDGYATAFLVSECHALAGSAAISAMPTPQRHTGGSTIELPGLRFGIGLKSGLHPGALSEASFRTSWPVTAQLVVPDDVDRKLFAGTGWWLLRLEGCEPGAKENGKAIAFDPVTSLELQEAGLPRKARHIGALMTEELALMEVPCEILGQVRRSSWESTCSSWLGMLGGPVVIFDPDRNAWVAVGFIPLPNVGLLLNAGGSAASGEQTFEVL